MAVQTCCRAAQIRCAIRSRVFEKSPVWPTLPRCWRFRGERPKGTLMISCSCACRRRPKGRRAPLQVMDGKLPEAKRRLSVVERHGRPEFDSRENQQRPISASGQKSDLCVDGDLGLTTRSEAALEPPRFISRMLTCRRTSVRRQAWSWHRACTRWRCAPASHPTRC
jgi:hypothetical protein